MLLGTKKSLPEIINNLTIRNVIKLIQLCVFLVYYAKQFSIFKLGI